MTARLRPKLLDIGRQLTDYVGNFTRGAVVRDKREDDAHGPFDRISVGEHVLAQLIKEFLL